MNLRDHIEPLSEAIGHALHAGLPDVREPETVFDREKGEHVLTGNVISRRPRRDEISVDMFCQSWGSTALGFGGVGGAAITVAYTIVITTYAGASAVYFGGRFAYRVEKPTVEFFEDSLARRMHEVRGAKERYERTT